MYSIFKKAILPILIFSCVRTIAQVKYDEGNVYIGGLTLLQDRNKESDYYYLPTYPRLAMKEDRTYEFLCINYKGEKNETTGGLFHALIEFKIPDSLLNSITKELRKITPGARIAGPVPLMQPKKDDPEIVTPSFDIVSGILSTKDGRDTMTRLVVTSGFAPLTPGSKAAVAAVLTKSGATLIWNSFTGPTSDVSVSIHGYYEAAVRAYNAVVTADMNVVYSHFGTIINQQKGFNKTQIRNETDKMIKSGGIKVDVFDRSIGLGVKTSDMDGILSIITNKLTEIMFDTKTGWSKEPDTVDPSLGFVDQGKQEKTGTINDLVEGFIDVVGALGVSSSKRNKNPEYRTDNQFILKDITRIRNNKFYLNLSKSTTIKVPFHTAGNLGGLYNQLGNDSRYFRIVNMNDPAFEHRTINFQVDGAFVDAFDDIVNFVTVNFRKKYNNDHEDVSSQLIINANDRKKDAIMVKTIAYPRLGLARDEDFSNYEYQLLWSFKGSSKSVRYPADPSQWIKSNDASISLIPPLVKDLIEIDADRLQFVEDSVYSLNISFFSVQGGVKKLVRNVILRATDTEPAKTVSVYHDPGSPIIYQGDWYSKSKGTAPLPAAVLSSGYIFLLPPTPDKFTK